MPRALTSSRPSWRARGRKPPTTSRTTSEQSTARRSKEKRSASRRARSKRSPTSRSRRRASALMTVAAPAGSSVAPSITASAYPRIDVRGVRSSWETDMRNWRSWSRARTRLAPMALMDSANPANSGSSCRVIGTLASRSPEAIRRVAVTAAATGRANRRARPRRHQGRQGQPDEADQGEVPEAVGRLVDLSGDHQDREEFGDLGQRRGRGGVDQEGAGVAHGLAARPEGGDVQHRGGDACRAGGPG